MDSINELWDRVGKAWEYGLAVLKTGGYVAILLICIEYEGVHFFVKGYFLSDLVIHGMRACRTRRRFRGRDWIELALYAGVAVWMFVEGSMFPQVAAHAGIMAVGFMSFLLLKWILLDWQTRREGWLLKHDKGV